MDLREFSPNDLVPYFAPPIETEFPAVLTVGQQIVTPNIYRCYLIVTAGNPGSGGLSFSLTQLSVGAFQGVGLTSQSPTVFMNVWDHGIIVTQPWYLSTVGTGTVSVIEVVALQRWPDGSDPLAAIMHPPFRRPAARPSLAPGQGGGRGILDYWRRITSQPSAASPMKSRPPWSRPSLPRFLR